MDSNQVAEEDLVSHATNFGRFLKAVGETLRDFKQGHDRIIYLVLKDLSGYVFHIAFDVFHPSCEIMIT